ncbi:MAG: ABC transporter permease [Chloroflexota bacterium]|nr:MAG: ABC transporter permease [Chloroflexota bacterium]
MPQTASIAHSKPAERRNVSSWLERQARFVFIAPALIALLLLVIFPIAYTIWMSLHNWQLSSVAQPRFIGLDNFWKLLTNDSRFLGATGRTLLFTLMATSVQLVLGVAMALLFNRQFLGRGFWRALAILPMVTTPVAIALIFVMMMHPTLGVLNYLLQVVGLPPSLWIYSERTVMLTLVMVDTWQWTPLIMLIVLAGLASMPDEPFEAARIDGASRVQVFFYITLPLLRPSIVVAALFRIIDAIKTFDIIFVMTSGGPGYASETINLYLFNTAFSYFDMGYASAIVVIFFTMIMVLAVLTIRVRRVEWQ